MSGNTDGAPDLAVHPLQYAWVDALRLYMRRAEPVPVPGRPPLRPYQPPVVTGTEGMDDSQVLDELARNPDLTPAGARLLEHRQGYGPFRVERYNRCPACEQWSPCDVRKQVLSHA